MSILVVILNALSMPILLLDYEARKDFIAENFCVNKSRPKLACNGKCFLKKSIEHEGEADQTSNAESFTVTTTFPIWVSNLFDLDFLSVSGFSAKKTYNTVIFLLKSSFYSSFLRPPQL